MTVRKLADYQSMSLQDIDLDANITKALLTEQGDIIYASAASTPAALVHGTTGQVLISGGHAANPSWSSAPIFSQVITDNSPLTVDDAAAADNDFAVFTANGIEGVAAQGAHTLLLAQVLAENDEIKLDPALSADGKWNGITVSGTAGATLAFGELCYLAVADSRWELAKADAAATSFGLLGICVLAAAGDASATNMLLWGRVRADAKFPALTVGAPVFISAATAGLVTSTAPAGTTNFVVRIVGHASTADELQFTPDPTYLELA